MISGNCIKHIKSLGAKKNRNRERVFVVEGAKTVAELLRSDMKVKKIYALKSWAADNAASFKGVDIQEVDESDMKKISVMQTAPEVLAEVFYKEEKKFSFDSGGLYLALDAVQDPGNFGTIIRIANWFGISAVLASHGCVDLYNSKTVQASMGSVFRVDVFYCDLPEILQKAALEKIPVYGTFLDGGNVYTEKLSPNGVIVLGNEGHGILPETQPFIKRKLFIPCGSDKKTAPESLNVSTAAAVVCSEFFRRKYLF